MKPLNPKQQAFVDEYLIDLNATQAAIRAGYSAKTAQEQSSRLLSNAIVKAAVEKALAARSERTGINAEWVLKRLAEEAEADLADLYDENDNLLPVRQWPKIWRTGLIAGRKVEELFDGSGYDRRSIGVAKEVRLADRHARIVAIGKHVGVNAFQDTVHHKGLEGLADRLARAKARDV